MFAVRGLCKGIRVDTIHFYSFVPLYAEEVAFKLEQGAEPLLERFAKNRVTELLDIKRVNVCKKKGWW